MKRIEDKKKALLIVGVVDLVMVAYMLLILLAFFKLSGQLKDFSNYKRINYIVYNSIITSESSLNSDHTFTYYSHNNEIDDNEELYFHSNKNENCSIGTYSPNSYIYGTEDKDLYISFKLENKKIYKLTYNQVFVSNMDGEEVKELNKNKYSTSKKDGYFTLKYSDTNPKYIYALSLSYYVKG